MKSGISIVELLVVMVILGIISIMVISTVLDTSDSASNAQIKNLLEFVSTSQEEFYLKNGFYMNILDPETPGYNNNSQSLPGAQGLSPALTQEPILDEERQLLSEIREEWIRVYESVSTDSRTRVQLECHLLIRSGNRYATASTVSSISEARRNYLCLGVIPNDSNKGYCASNLIPSRQVLEVDVSRSVFNNATTVSSMENTCLQEINI